MTQYFKPCMDILPVAQQRLWPELHPSIQVLVPCGTTQDQHLKVSFFGTIGFGRIGEPEITDDGTSQVATLDDLMATKVKVILQRIEAKD